MRTNTRLVVSLFVLLGVAGAFLGYRHVAPATAGPASSAAADATPVQKAKPLKPRIRVRVERCPRGFHRKAHECLRTRERTVVVDVTPPPSPAPPPTMPPTSPPTSPPTTSGTTSATTVAASASVGGGDTTYRSESGEDRSGEDERAGGAFSGSDDHGRPLSEGHGEGGDD